MGPCIVTRDELPDWGRSGSRPTSTASCARAPGRRADRRRPGGDRVDQLDHQARAGGLPDDRDPCRLRHLSWSLPSFLKPGDAVTVSASGIGELTNPVVAGTARTSRRLGLGAGGASRPRGRRPHFAGTACTRCERRGSLSVVTKAEVPAAARAEGPGGAHPVAQRPTRGRRNVVHPKADVVQALPVLVEPGARAPRPGSRGSTSCKKALPASR